MAMESEVAENRNCQRLKLVRAVQARLTEINRLEQKLADLSDDEIRYRYPSPHLA